LLTLFLIAQWENLNEENTVRFRYPPDDLLPKLVDNYFIYMNPFLPILHRPSFERAIASRHHYADIGFGSVVMLVCGIGSRWSDDMRVRGEGLWRHSAGWKYFDQVEAHRRSFLGPPRLYDLQIYAVRLGRPRRALPLTDKLSHSTFSYLRSFCKVLHLRSRHGH
jgi:hypothetical protein